MLRSPRTDTKGRDEDGELPLPLSVVASAPRRRDAAAAASLAEEMPEEESSFLFFSFGGTEAAQDVLQMIAVNTATRYADMKRMVLYFLLPLSLWLNAVGVRYTSAVSAGSFFGCFLGGRVADVDCVSRRAILFESPS